MAAVDDQQSIEHRIEQHTRNQHAHFSYLTLAASALGAVHDCRLEDFPTWLAFMNEFTDRWNALKRIPGEIMCNDDWKILHFLLALGPSHGEWIATLDEFATVGGFPARTDMGIVLTYNDVVRRAESVYALRKMHEEESREEEYRMYAARGRRRGSRHRGASSRAR